MFLRGGKDGRRRLASGHADDVRFDPGKRHLFGVSRYEIAGRQRDPAVEQPEYGMGDTAEALTLSTISRKSRATPPRIPLLPRCARSQNSLPCFASNWGSSAHLRGRRGAPMY